MAFLGGMVVGSRWGAYPGRRTLAGFMVAVLAAAPAQAGVIHVDAANVSGVETGSPATPFNTIAEGLAAAQPGDTVQVAAGTYPEAVAIPPGVGLAGAGRDVTFIDATGLGSSAVVMTGAGLAPRTSLTGFTVRGGSGTDLGLQAEFTVDAIGGGGVLLRGDGLVESCRIEGNELAGDRPSFLGAGIYTIDGEPTITRNEILGNAAIQTHAGAYGARTYAIGGGIFVGFYSRPLISQNTISGNVARALSGDPFSVGVGGGIAVYAGEPLPTRIDSNFITDNQASDFSGGVNVGTTLVGSSNSVITNNVIAGNIAARNDATALQSYGGGIYFYYADVVFTNNTVQANSADIGAGMLVGYSYPTAANPEVTNHVVVTNNVVVRNSASGGGGVYMEGSPQTFAANDVFGNTPNEYQPAEEYRTGIAGNIGAEPHFVAEPLRDFYLLPESPCIDAGRNSGSPPTDIEGTNRPIDGDLDGVFVTDMGAYEFSTPTDSDGDGTGDRFDNCPGAPNPLQEDGDADGIGNVCDNCPVDYNPDQGDTDNDSVADACDTCPAVPNPSQQDQDRDGIGDPCDNCQALYNTAQADLDGDMTGDVCDNCPEVSNPDQQDFDSDLAGDACDLDDDDDGVPDVSDCAPLDFFATILPAEIPPTLTVEGPADDTLVDWEPAAQSLVYDLYRGDTSVLGPFAYNHGCSVLGLLETTYHEPAVPLAGLAWYYLPAGRNVCGSGALGFDSADPPASRPLLTACPPSPGDADEDGIPDISDLCPHAPETRMVDEDGDRLSAACDNCIGTANADQANLDQDLWGDACDGDADNDGIPNAADARPLAADGPVLPGEVGASLRFVDTSQTLAWDSQAGASGYALYRLGFSELSPPSRPFSCLQGGLLLATAQDPTAPAVGQVLAYLATVLDPAGESSAGQSSSGQLRSLSAPCP